MGRNRYAVKFFRTALFLNLLIHFSVSAQNSFQKIYNWSSDMYCFGAFQTNDEGYMITGIIDDSGQKLYMCRTDCRGEIVWIKTYSPSSTVGNISQRVIQTSDQGYLLAGSIGFFQAYNILAVKTDAAGNTQWKKAMMGSRDDLVNSVIQTTDSGYVFAGTTSTYGQDASGNAAYRDVYLLKTDKAGNLLWTRTFGNHQTVDEAFDVIETFDGGLAVTGRYIHAGTFQAFLLKTDPFGNMQFMKTYGDTLQGTTGYGLIQLPDSGYAITGSTTIIKPSFQSMPDVFLIRTKANGDTLWCKAYHGTNTDGSESGSSLVTTATGGFAIGVPTFSYPTVGVVPNKHAVFVTDTAGHLNLARTYNNGSSHYTYITRAKIGLGFVISGFQNFQTTHFNPLVIRTDNLFNSGCNETNVLPLTVEAHAPFKVSVPAVSIDSGGILSNNTLENAASLSTTDLCISIVDSCDVHASVGENSGESILPLIFPNPAEDFVWLPGNGIEKIEVYDLTGKMILCYEILQLPSKINVSALARGNYIIRAVSKSGTAEKKLIKR